MAANLVAAREAAEAFRAEHIRGKPFDGSFPLDVVFVADNVLRLDLIDFPGLEEMFGSAAYVTASLTELYVDEALMSAYSSRSAPPWRKDRLRFSVAHEIGHIWMHKELVPKIRCQTIEDLKTLFNANDAQRNDIEKEANEFAGRLIVPMDKLKEAAAAFGKMSGDPKWRDSGELRARFCEQCGPHFGINSEGLRVRLDREYVWPAEWTTGG